MPPCDGGKIGNYFQKAGRLLYDTLPQIHKAKKQRTTEYKLEHCVK
jgi:hypothetical protein